MRKLKSLSQEFANVHCPKENTDFNKELKLINSLAFEEGFKIAFKIINEEMDKEKKLFDDLPMMTERKAAISRLQKKLNGYLEEML